jgi:transposase
MSTNVARRNIWNRSIYFIEPIPKFFGYSLGGYSHRERCHAPDRKKSTKEGEESKLVIKNKLMDRRFRHNWLHLVSKELWLHC